MSQLRVAIVAPPFGETGGPEIVAKNLAIALHRLGIDVTIFAPADWNLPEIKHIHTLEKSLWNMNLNNLSADDRKKIRLASQTKVLEYEKDFDIIHLHSQRYAPDVASKTEKACVLTLHNKTKQEDLQNYKKLGIYSVRLSNAQEDSKHLTSTIIGNGIAVKEIDFSTEKGNYLIAVGRLADQKGIDLAIQITKKAEKKLIIFGRIGKSSERQKYFKEKIEPFIDGEQIIYKGEAANQEIHKYMMGAEALLFPIKRPETFGLVPAETLASGTPVIATRIAPLPEILTDDHTCFLSNDLDELSEAAKHIDHFDRAKCREYAGENFDRSVMAKKYIDLYQQILASR